MRQLNLSKQKILVTGAQGFLGKHLIRNLITKRKVPPTQILTPTHQELDLTVWKNCQKAVAKADVVIHLAAKVGGIGANMEKPGEFFYDNLMMSSQLMEASRQAGVKKYVGIGTICSYPKYTPIPFQEEDLWNGYPEETNAPYGLAKKMQIVQAVAYRQQYNFNAINLLPVNMYGPEDNSDPTTSHVIPSLIKKIYSAKIQHHPSVTVWGTGAPTRESLFVEDGAEAILLATEKYNDVEPINLGGSHEISIKDLVIKLCLLMGYQGQIVWDESKPDGQPRRKLDTTRAQDRFGFTAQTSFDEGLNRTIIWYEQQQTT